MPTFEDRESLASVRAKINAAITWVDTFVPTPGPEGSEGPEGPPGAEGPEGPPGADGSFPPSFETVNTNLSALGATLGYTSGRLTTVTYTGGIIKTLNYTGENLTSVVLSGSTPGGIELTKTLTYSGGNLTNITYS